MASLYLLMADVHTFQFASVKVTELLVPIAYTLRCIFLELYLIPILNFLISFSCHILGNSGGPAFNDQGECIGVAFQVGFLVKV